jgi:SAM-dependent methyltransferase
VVSNPNDHEAFYQREIGALASAGSADVLISGAADDAMLDHVLRAYARVAAEPRVTVIDICATPLALCQQRADRAGVSIETRRGDLLDEPLQRRFDLIVTDAFLTRFAPEPRRLVLNRWHRLLRPGGRVVTTAGFNPVATNGAPTRTRPAARAEFVRLVLAAAQTQDALGDATPDTIESLATTYTSRLVTYPFASAAAVTDTFADAGFRVTESENSGQRELLFTGVARIVATQRTSLR